MTQAAAYLTLGPLALATTVQSFMGAILGINASAMTVTDLALAPGAAIGPSSASANVRAEVVAAPADSFSAHQVGMHMECCFFLPFLCSAASFTISAKAMWKLRTDPTHAGSILQCSACVYVPFLGALTLKSPGTCLATQKDGACAETGAAWCMQDLRAAQATRALQDAAGQASPNQLLVLLGAPLVERGAICGNQVCEPGERAPAGASGLGASRRNA